MAPEVPERQRRSRWAAAKWVASRGGSGYFFLGVRQNPTESVREQDNLEAYRPKRDEAGCDAGVVMKLAMLGARQCHLLCGKLWLSFG
jgi:hypothetical protein